MITGRMNDCEEYVAGEENREVGIWKPMEGVNHHFDNFVRSQGQLCG